LAQPGAFRARLPFAPEEAYNPSVARNPFPRWPFWPEIKEDEDFSAGLSFALVLAVLVTLAYLFLH
jgi:hypothetical protein